MKTIILNNISYNLVDSPNVSADRIQATILKENHAVETIVEDAKGNEVITVKEDDEVVGVYNGYTDFMCAYLYNHDEDVVVSVEITNHDMQSQINIMHEEVVTNANAIENLDKKVDGAVETFGDKAQAADILLGN